MGLFCVNMHFRTTDDEALSAALNRRGVNRYQIVPAKDGWTSLYEEEASGQDDERIRELVGGLSADLNVAAVSFLVHDSDVACYWLFEGGQLLDHYNSCPDYFDDEATDGESLSPSGGRPDVLLPYCRSGVGQDGLTAILTQQTVFAENVIEQLAEALGIDVQRALTDYRDVGRQEGAGGMDGFGHDDEDSGGGPSAYAHQTALEAGLAQVLGSDPRNANVDPQATALVHAAAGGDAGEIDRLLAEGVAVDSEAPAPLPGGQPMSGLGQLFPRGVPQLVMTPLLAAVANNQRGAAERLLEAGADPNHGHPLFGSPIHAAVGAAQVELLQLLIDRGGDTTARNAQGQTPLDVVAAGRATLERLAQVQTLMQSLGTNVPGVTDPLPVEKLLSEIELPMEGWDACERVLKAHAAQ